MHYLWLVFQEQPLVVYLDGPGFYGAGIPLVGSLLILLWVFAGDVDRIHKRVTGKNLSLFGKRIWGQHYQGATHGFPAKLVLGFFLTNIVIGHYSGYWTSVGYHFFDAGMIFWPILALLESRFPWMLAYPLTFIGMLADDVYAAGLYSHWTPNFWFGVGGAGLHDGLFIGPITTLALTLLFASVGSVLRRRGLILNAM